MGIIIYFHSKMFFFLHSLPQMSLVILRINKLIIDINNIKCDLIRLILRIYSFFFRKIDTALQLLGNLVLMFAF
jgi:hypothetical protein